MSEISTAEFLVNFSAPILVSNRRFVKSSSCPLIARLHNLARIYSERDNCPQDESKHKMNWSWTDFAFKCQLRLVGWAKNAAFPKDHFAVKTLKQGPLKSMVKPCMILLERSAGREDEDSDIEDDLAPQIVHIESWTEGKLSLCLFCDNLELTFV